MPQNLGRLETNGYSGMTPTKNFGWNVPLLKNTKANVIPIPAQMENVLVYLMTFFASAIQIGLAKHAVKKVNIIVLLKYLCNIFVDVLFL